ncbi:MAG: protein kinase, partial [Planctomycetaceae bacterium]
MSTDFPQTAVSGPDQHPEDAMLADFAVGRLDEATSRRIEMHLASCEECCTRVESCAGLDDTLVECVRQHAGANVPAAVPLRVHAGYELLDEVGQGGMAVVYRARQVALGRIVALKQIRSGVHATADELIRFRREVNAVARLNHPAIVQVFDSGEQDGQPYLAMEFMNGGTLADRIEASPLEGRQTARLIAHLADGVESAHANGIIHRDLKPGNVLFRNAYDDPTAVDILDGEPKIADFGLARADYDHNRTETGIALGTPGYMAPEQITGGTSVAAAADVYGLGAVLYQCITGRQPFQGATILETLRQVREDSPVAPSALQPRCPRDLETICLKCLNKEPAARYASAAALRDDVQRFILGQAIHARRASVAERAWKWCRRRPAIAALVAVVVMALVGSSVAGWVVSGVLRNSLRDRTAAQKKAETSLQHARDTWNSNLWDLAVGTLADVPDSGPQRRELMELAVRQYEELFDDGDSGDESTRHAYNRLLMSLGNVLSDLNASADADATFEKGIRLADQLAAEFPDKPEYQFQTAETRTNFGAHLIRLTRWQEARDALLPAQEILERLVAESENPLQWLSYLSTNSGFLSTASGRLLLPDDAIRFRTRALDTARQVQESHPTDPVVRKHLATIFHNNGLAAVDVPEALELIGQSVEILESLVHEHPESRVDRGALANVLISLSNMQSSTDFEAALVSIDRARELCRQLTAQFPASVDWRLESARADYNAAVIRLGQGRDEEMVELLQSSRDLYRQIINEDRGDDRIQASCAATLNLLGLCLTSTMDLSGAEATYREALQIGEEQLARHPGELDHQEVIASTSVNLAELLRQTGRAQEALSVADRAVEFAEEIYSKQVEPVDAKTALVPAHGCRAYALQALGRHSDAIADWDR